MLKEYESATLVPDEEEPRRMMSEKQILDLLPIARSTLQNWERDGLFPKSVPVGKNRKAWFQDEVIAWQKEKGREAASNL
jgi:prophage regulatory protein